jgi:hypothetical protein
LGKLCWWYHSWVQQQWNKKETYSYRKLHNLQSSRDWYSNNCDLWRKQSFKQVFKTTSSAHIQLKSCTAKDYDKHSWKHAILQNRNLEKYTRYLHWDCNFSVWSATQALPTRKRSVTSWNGGDGSSKTWQLG